METGKKLVELINQHKELFVNSVERRQWTSVFNKDIHQEVLDAIEVGDDELLEELVMSNRYRRPLNGVVYCMCDGFMEVKLKFIKFIEENGLHVY